MSDRYEDRKHEPGVPGVPSVSTAVFLPPPPSLQVREQNKTTTTLELTK